VVSPLSLTYLNGHFQCHCDAKKLFILKTDVKLLLISNWRWHSACIVLPRELLLNLNFCSPVAHSALLLSCLALFFVEHTEPCTFTLQTIRTMCLAISCTLISCLSFSAPRHDNVQMRSCHWSTLRLKLENHTRATERCHFRWPSVTPTPSFKVTLQGVP